MNDPDIIWLSLRLTVRDEAVEAIEFALNSLEALGTEIDYMQQPASGVRVVGYFERMPEDEAVQDEIHYALRSYGLDENAVVTIERGEVQNTDWLAEWKKHWKPTVVGRFVIAPPWEKVEVSDGILIRIEPNMAFGTGTHETTQLCLNAIDEHYSPGDSFLDVGTGTGILAIAAALKSKVQGPTSKVRGPLSEAEDTNEDPELVTIIAIDNDPDSIKIARENAYLNGVGNLIEFRECEITGNLPQFDLVCANLTLDVIQPILSELFSKAKKYLILSGILVEQEASIFESLRKNSVSSPELRRAGEWIAVIVRV